MQITVLQALLLGLFAFLIGTSLFPLGWLSQNIMGKPLITSAIIGLIMGDVKTAILVGVPIQAVNIGQMSIGGVSTLPRIDTSLWFALPIMLATGNKDIETLFTETLAICYAFVPVNDILGTVGNMVKVAILHKQDDIIEKGHITDRWWFPICGHVWTFVQNFVIVVVFCLVGSNVVMAIVNVIPPQVNKIMSTFTGLLPAIGFMVLMVTLIHEPLQWIYFLFGFILAAGLGWSTIAITIVGCVVAYLVFQFTPGKQAVAAEEDDD